MNEPVEYKKGYTNFAGCKIDLSMEPLIPRKETEFWAKKTIQKIKSQKSEIKNPTILDIFAGSGCIGIAILKHIKNSRVVFAEIDKKLIKQIKLNLELNKIDSKRYKVIQSDIFKQLASQKAGFDYIFANPPYISLKNKHLIQRSVLNFEPHKALFGGNDGLFFIRRFLKQARSYLKKERLPAACLPVGMGGRGKIYMEFDHLQKTGLERLLKKLNYTNYKIYKDQLKKYRYVCIKN